MARAANSRLSQAPAGASSPSPGNGKARRDTVASSSRTRPRSTQRYINRELSWLDFNSRVLALAEDSAGAGAGAGQVPGHRQPEHGRVLPGPGRRPQGAGRRRRGHHRPGRHDAFGTAGGHPPRGRGPGSSARTAFTATRLLPLLRDADIRIVGTDDLDDAERSWLLGVFEERIFPVLTPLAVDPAHPFPYISNLSLNLAVQVRDPVRRRTRFARVKVPPILPRFIVMPDGARFIPLEQVIAAHLEALFPG